MQHSQLSIIDYHYLAFSQCLTVTLGLYAPAVLQPGAPRLRALPFSAAHGPTKLVIGEKKEKKGKKSYQEIFLVIRRKVSHQQLSLNSRTTAKMGKIKKKGMLLESYSLRS